ncbi:sensor domain-containing diguanylate cyclase [Pseudodesulfovibrio indicus]|uniref:sensor domain-containing diguanylate cyclase n=1 Tax=Pseudodesulfovibrio indicus TaxID=1716143 RepID=UPI00293033E4|nr:sensor domain-containing diguanylate cyclase [Pseudodesulfovibrio indicus]
MSKDIFHKEATALDQARAALDSAMGLDRNADRAFRALIDRYAKLLRQSERMATMGDRMQNSLNRLNRELAASESKYRGVFENVTEGIYRCGKDGDFIEVNPSLAGMFGFSSVESFLEKLPNIRLLFPAEEDYARYRKVLDSESVRRREVRAASGGGNELWVELSASLMGGEEDGDGTVVGVMTDVTERRYMLEEMCRLARTDSLTGLWNRGYFMELANHEVARSRRSGTCLSLIILDLDYFKGVNDTHGHDVGDRALIETAGRIRASVREIDVVGRYGGEEFVVLLPDADTDDACAIADRILHNLRSAPVDCGTVRLDLTASIGLTSMRAGDDLDAPLKFADIALYAAKKKGRDRAECYRRERCPEGGCVLATEPGERKEERP